MNAREEAMRRHPSGQHVPHTPDRIQALIDASHDQEAMDVANRERADLEAWAGGPMYRVDEKHHEVSTGRWGALLDLVVPIVIGLVIFGVVWACGFAGALVGGWPA